jgi:hypothetical protein
MAPYGYIRVARICIDTSDTTDPRFSVPFVGSFDGADSLHVLIRNTPTMKHINHEIEIEAPIDVVFAWGRTPQNWSRVLPSLRSIELLEETPEGTRFRGTIDLLGRDVTSEALFTVDEGNWETVFIFDDKEISGDLRYDYTETENGTIVEIVGDLTIGDSLFDRMLQPIAIRALGRQFKGSLRTMQDLIEADVGVVDQAAVEA